MKSNKSFTKRLKQTKKGKVLSRPVGQNHFNAKESGAERTKKRSLVPLSLSKKVRDQFLPKK